MFSWAPYSFVRIVILYTAGILVGIYYPEIISTGISILLLSLFSIAFVAIAILRFKGKKLFNPGSLGLAAVFLAGYIQLYNSTDSNHNDHFLYYPQKILAYKAVISNQGQEKESSWKVEAKVLAILGEDSTWHQKSGKVLLYFSKKDFIKPFHYGDELLVEGSPHELQGPANPGEFDYKRFLTFRKTYHQQYLQKGMVISISNHPPNIWMHYAIEARIWADQALKQNISGAREQAIASALVLGVTDGLDNDLLNAYSATGAMHVLAVSGLHVGIIYWLISLLLKPLNRNEKGRWVLAIISIIILWAYAFITGLSPSVLRAVTMFSFVALARPWGQRTNIYNTLAASAFCLLLYEPYLIMSVGFQLSYLAVIGIVYLQPMLYRLWEPRSLLLDKIWQITCVSIAAQIATFSLGLLYFHQFPVYFLFSNLFVIPGSFLVLVMGIGVIAISYITPLALGLGFLLEWIIRILNFGVFSVEAFPFSLIDHIYITTFQCWMLMVAIIAIFFLIEFRKFSFVVISALSIFTFSYLQWTHYFDEVDQQKLVVYKVSGHSAFDIMDNGRSIFFLDSTLTHDRERMRFHIRPNRLESGIHEIVNFTDLNLSKEFKGCRIIHWRQYSILHIYAKNFSCPQSLQVDFLIASANAVKSFSAVSFVKFKTLILDSSNSLYFSDKILQQAQTDSRQIYSVLHQGAFITKL